MVSGPVPDGGSPVVVCPSCDGLGFAVVACRCTDGGDRLLVTDGMDRPAGEPYRDCLLCQGDGAVGEPCHDCGQTGRRRAQLVLTMANLDTGAVASANVVPGVVEPVPWPGDGGESWYLPLGPLLRDLAAVVGVESWTDARQPGSPDGPLVLLPRAWRPESPEVARRAEEAAALAGESLDAWRVYLGRGRPAPARDPAVELGRWCRLADLLCLDLVVEARQQPAGAGLTWTVRYEVPGTPVPDRAVGHAGGLAGAILATSDADVCCGLAERGLTAPAHRLAAGYQPRTDPPVIDLDRLERRILDDCASTAAVGAQAVWRDGHWWHTTLHVAGNSERFVEWPTGQIVTRQTVLVRRGWEPPAPSWQGPAIPYADCPDCDPRSRLKRCDCRLATGRADPDCPRCAGAGRAPSLLRCDTCHDTHRIHDGVTVTVTDLSSRVVHLTWQADPAGWRAGETTWHATGGGVQPGRQGWRSGRHLSAPVVATHPGGKPVYRLPALFRLEPWADMFGVRPEDLIDLDSGAELDHDLRHGTVTPRHAGDDPLTAYLRHASRGRAGGRVFVLARRPDAPPLAHLVRLVLGLRLAVTITVVDHSRNAGDLRLVQGERWDVTIRPPGGPVALADPPTRPTPEAATVFCLDYLDLALAAATPTDPHTPIPVPQTPSPYDIDDPVPLLRRLARHHAGQPVAAHYHPGTCQLWIRDHDGVQHLATAPTLPAALHTLHL